MDSFTYYAPTRVVFGKNAESQTGELIRQCGGTKVLIHYGGGSVVRSGLLNKVEENLKAAGLPFVLLGGVVPNPRLSKVYEGIALCRAENVDFILAVGGGSVLDSAKAISVGVPYEGDVWDFYSGKTPAKALKHGNIITLAATGSETSNSSVITKDDGMLKRGSNHDFNRPAFTCMNPELLYTLPPYQTGCGAADIFMHTLERYFSNSCEGGVTAMTDALAVSVLRTVIAYGPICLKEPENYDARSEIMWAGSLSHNHLTGLGRKGDWATHKIEHELSAYFDVAHGAGLTAVWGSWARYVLPGNAERFAAYGRDVWGISDENGVEQAALAAIARTEQFFTELGMPVNLSQLLGRPATEEELRACAKKCVAPAGTLKILQETDIFQIYTAANK